jgi:hypothetical protein
MHRREALAFLGLGSGIGVATLLIGCDADAGPADPPHGEPDAGDDPAMPDASTTTQPDACVAPTVLMHDTNAQALYLDGTYGPLTGNIRVSYVIAGTTLTLDFWHGHGGTPHRFTLEPMHFEKLKQGQKVMVGTTTVDGHAHTLFIDPKDENYRVPGAPDVPVSLGC